MELVIPLRMARGQEWPIECGPELPISGARLPPKAYSNLPTAKGSLVTRRSRDGPWIVSAPTVGIWRAMLDKTDNYVTHCLLR